MNEDSKKDFYGKSIEAAMTAAVFTYGLLWSMAALLAPLAIIKFCLAYLA